ncbi:MAG: ATP-dependent 6-phosphofructokinase [Anaerolineaceae bacterium]|nr:ATP-dependent 6-phosphofructokinase [Anaerolineaceae bacterium]
MKRIAVLTGGGDAPGLNAVIRAVVKTAIQDCSCEVLGIRDGVDGFLKPDGILPMDTAQVRGILPRGGTILGTANRGNPFAHRLVQGGEEVIIDQSDAVIRRIQDLKLDALVIAGGDGTLNIAQRFYRKGVPVVGIPKTIDNDIGGTDFSFGFDSAVNCAMEAIDRLHTTAESHHRVMVLELMGRHAGFIALHAGVSGGADVILIPEIPFRMEAVVQQIRMRQEKGSPFSILAVSEGATLQGSRPVYASLGDEINAPRLGGIGEMVNTALNNQYGIESRLIVLGHLQRGGSPTAFDRWLGTNFGSSAVHLAAAGRFGHMVSLHGSQIEAVSLEQALAVTKRVDPHSNAVRTARAMGMYFGDEVPA